MTGHASLDESGDAILPDHAGKRADAVDLSCPHRSRHAVLLLGEGVVEVKCDRSHCGAGRGRVVLHRFDVRTGELLETLRFADPTPKKG